MLMQLIVSGVLYNADVHFIHQALRSTLQGMAKSLYTSVQSLITAQKSFNMKRLEETASDFAMAKKSAQEAEINHMADILTSLTNHYDQVGGAMKCVLHFAYHNVHYLVLILLCRVFQSKSSEYLDISGTPWTSFLALFRNCLPYS